MKYYDCLVAGGIFWVWYDGVSDDILVINSEGLRVLHQFMDFYLYNISFDFVGSLQNRATGIYYRGQKIVNGSYGSISHGFCIQYRSYCIFQLLDVFNDTILVVTDLKGDFVGSYDRSNRGISSVELAKLLLELGNKLPLLSGGD